MSAPSTEQIMPEVIGKVVVIPAYHSLEAALRGAVNELDENYCLQSEETFVKGPLVKYGILDVTFQNKKTQQFLKVYCQADEAGYVPHIQQSGKQFEADEMREYMLRYLKDIEALFPLRATIIDCCLTNDQEIWTEKHFYS